MVKNTDKSREKFLFVNEEEVRNLTSCMRNDDSDFWKLLREKLGIKNVDIQTSLLLECSRGQKKYEEDGVLITQTLDLYIFTLEKVYRRFTTWYRVEENRPHYYQNEIPLLAKIFKADLGLDDCKIS